MTELDKDKVLPVKAIFAFDQRDVDWERVRFLVKASQEALEHVIELEEAWSKGVLSEHDGLGGTRSNRNIGIKVMLTEALARLGMEMKSCQHTRTKWCPDNKRPGCEEGTWKCLDCGAWKQKAYRPFLEHWEGGADKGPHFLSLWKGEATIEVRL